MSLYVQKRGERDYLYFQAGRGKSIYIGPVGKAKRKAVREAMKYLKRSMRCTKGRLEKYERNMQRLEELLNPIDHQ